MTRQFPSSLGMTRRRLLAAAAALIAVPTEECRSIGPPQHAKGPLVFMDYDQVELDAAYDQSFYAPLGGQISRRYASNSEDVRARLGAPKRMAYGPSEAEKLDIYRTKKAKAPIFVFIHGGAWLGGEAKNYGFAAESIVKSDGLVSTRENTLLSERSLKFRL